MTTIEAAEHWVRIAGFAAALVAFPIAAAVLAVMWTRRTAAFRDYLRRKRS